MALQQNVLENGEWVTRTVDPQELFRQTRNPQDKAKKLASNPPAYGLLTKTVIESPIIHWALPVQIRSASNNDVALIGSNFVQICELGPDLQLQNVVRKQDFGSRIRNACVIGTPEKPTWNHGRDGDEEIRTDEVDDDIDMTDTMASSSQRKQHHNQLPPQILILFLERGQLVFLYLRTGSRGELEFVCSIHDIWIERLRLPGFHMKVDPSSRYLTLADLEDIFLVYELYSMETLRERHLQGLPLNPVKDFKSRAVNGVIHKIEFLYPIPDNEQHVILMLIIIRHEVSRVAIYDWEHGDDLTGIFREEQRGHRLEQQWSMPLLVIPLTILNGFILVTESHMGHCVDGVNGQFGIESISDPNDEAGSTELHIGKYNPLWTAWARPSRERDFLRQNDVIYLVREDGVVKLLEVSADGIDTALTLEQSIDCKVDTALACLWHPDCDVLLAGGDSGPGAILSIRARNPPVNEGTIPNWSPTVDFVATTRYPSNKLSKSKRRIDSNGGRVLRSDRLFACSGRGKGTITEFRHGLEAKVGLEIDYDTPIRQCWVLPPPVEVTNGSYLLLALPNGSAILHLYEDFSHIAEKDQREVPYDLSSSTLAAEELDGRVIQVTTSSITIITPTDSTRHLSHEFDAGSSSVIAHCALRKDNIALALHAGSQFGVRTFTVDGLNITSGLTRDVDGEVTCVSLGVIADKIVLFAGIWRDSGPVLAIYPTDDSQEGPVELDLSTSMFVSRVGEASLELNRCGPTLEALTSIVITTGHPAETTLVFGTRNGDVVTLTLDNSAPDTFKAYHDKFGLSAAQVSPLSTGVEPQSVFICCDSELVVMARLSADREAQFAERLRVWATDSNNIELAAPAIQSVTRMSRTSENGKVTILMMAGAKIYVAELQAEPTTVPRYIKVHGTPTKIMYSESLDALVVAVIKDNLQENGEVKQRPSLLFIDPDTGLDLSLPTASTGQPTDHISGLDKGTRILALANWRFQKDNSSWEYIVVSVATGKNEGKIALVTAKEDESTVEGGRKRIRFSTKSLKPKDPAPIFSIATDAQGLLLCSGNWVYYDVLDTEEKKFKRVKEHELSSPATWMEVVDGHLHVVTTQHSLEVLHYKSNTADSEMKPLHTDPQARQLIHCVEAGEQSSKDHYQPVILCSDMSCGIWGLWAPPQDEKSIQTIFQAELGSSIRRFVRGHTRPQWQLSSRHAKYGSVPSSSDESDIVGIGFDGSLHHFTLLQIDTWRLLRFIQNLALVSSLICPFSQVRVTEDWSPEPQPLPKIKMHIDGDVLQRCLSKRALERLISQTEHILRFRQLLEAVDGGKYTQPFVQSNDAAPYFKLAYDILKYHLAPVL